MKLLVATLMTCAGLLGAAAALATPTTISVLQGPTTVESYGGVEVWSAYDATDRSWHVVARRNGRISTPSIPVATKAIEVDVGPGPSGVPMLSYISCAAACHLVVSAVDGGDPQVVPGSERASHPTIWGDRVAWLNGKTRVITSRLDGSARKILPGVPARKCYYVGDETETTKPRLQCAAPEDPIVEALQLYRGQLALIDSFIIQDGVGSVGTTREVRTEPIAGGPQRLVAIISVGEGNEQLVGPSWSNGKLYFYEDGDGTASKVYRYDPTRNTYAMGPAYAYLSGFSVIGNRAYEATTSPNSFESGTCQPQEGEQCVLRLSEPLAFKPTRAPVYVP